MFTISRTTPSNIESSTFAQHNNNTTFRSRACTSRDGGKKKKEKNEGRHWIHRWPGFLGSWKVFSSAGECKHCCLLESSLVPGSRASSLVISPLFPPLFLRPAAAILPLLLSFPSSSSSSPFPTAPRFYCVERASNHRWKKVFSVGGALHRCETKGYAL